MTLLLSMVVNGLSDEWPANAALKGSYDDQDPICNSHTTGRHQRSYVADSLADAALKETAKGLYGGPHLRTQQGAAAQRSSGSIGAIPRCGRDQP